MKKLWFSLFTCFLILFSFNALASSEPISFEAPEMMNLLEGAGKVKSEAVSLAEDAGYSRCMPDTENPHKGYSEPLISSASDYGAKANDIDYNESSSYGGAAKILFRQLHPT